jgi:membrane-associated phospholipid phosphatase
MTNFADILQPLVQLDRWLFHQINGQWTNSFFDFIFPWLRLSLLWLPLYLFVFIFVGTNFLRHRWWWMVFFLCTVAATDMAGKNLFKDVFKRLRPCNDPGFVASVRLLLRECAGGYGFVSNHAANHFGMAAFFYFTLRRYFPRWVWLAWAWAFVIAYGQIYVGIHYPFDVFAGSAIGIAFGWTMATFFNRKFGFATFGLEPTSIS